MIKSIVFVTFSVLALRVAAEPSVIRITNGEWEPYLSEYSYQYGLASHIVKEAFEVEGITVEWGFMPWIRSYENARLGQDWDAAAVWWPTDAARKDFLVSLPVVKTSMVFFHLKGFKFEWRTMDDLQGLTVGFTRGYEYGKEFDLAREKGVFTISEVTTDEQNFEMLFHGRIDVFPNDPVVGASQVRNSLSKEKVAKIVHHPLEFEKSTLHLLVSKEAEHRQFFLEKFNSGMKKLEASGQLEMMFRDMDKGVYDKKKYKWESGTPQGVPPNNLGALGTNRLGELP